MKIALLTIWHEKNYGAELQAYATIKTLTNLGYEAVMINILLSDQYQLTLKNRCAKAMESLSPYSRKFSRFWKKYIPVTRRYDSMEELQKNPPEADIYLVGSDQVWNPEITKDFQELYFLNFGDTSVKRISYASSFGQSDIIYRDEHKVQALLDRFDSICCRESSGIDLLRSRFGRESTLVVDPCLLLDSYIDFVSDTKENGTLCFYPLSKDDELESYSLKLASSLGLRPINANRTIKIMGKIIWDRPGIEDWLNYIAHSDFVLTRSFHGVVFSLIFKKQFGVLFSHNGRSTRLITLLRYFDLEDRLFDSVESLDKAEPWKTKINYDVVTSKLNQLREDSIEILKNMILECH